MRPSGAGLGNMSGQECTFSYMYTGQIPPGQVPLRTSAPVDKFQFGQFPPGQVPLRTSSPRTSSPGRQASKKDKFPPDKFPYGQVPPGQVPLASSPGDLLPQVNYMNIIMLMLICGVESSDYWELAFKNNSKYFLLRSLLGSGYTLWSN